MLSVYHLLIPLGTPLCTAPCLSHSAWIPHQACHLDRIGQGQPQKISPCLILTEESRFTQLVCCEYAMTLHLTRGPPTVCIQTATHLAEAVCCTVPCYALLPSSTPMLWGVKYSSPSPSLSDKPVLLLRHGSHIVAGALSTEQYM